MTELALFDIPETSSPATVYARPNVDHGHLLLATDFGDWMFVWTGVLHTYFPGITGAIRLTADQMRIVGDYCLRMAERMERK